MLIEHSTLDDRVLLFPVSNTATIELLLHTMERARKRESLYAVLEVDERGEYKRIMGTLDHTIYDLDTALLTDSGAATIKPRRRR